MVRYSLQISDEADVNIALMDYLDGSVVNSTTKTFSKCPTSCYHRLTTEFLYLNEGKLNVLANSAQSDLKLVRSSKRFKLVRHSSDYNFICVAERKTSGFYFSDLLLLVFHRTK
jgi:hypothetical protein